VEFDRVSPDPYDTVASANALRSEASFGSQQKFVQPEQKTNYEQAKACSTFGRSVYETPQPDVIHKPQH
jgi:hypothetical protein